MNMLQVGYCSWLLLLWLTALYLVTGLGGQDNTLRFLHIIFPWRTKCLHINYLQEPDPWYRPARHGLHHPQLPHGAVLHHLLNPQRPTTENAAGVVQNLLSLCCMSLLGVFLVWAIALHWSKTFCWSWTFSARVGLFCARGGLF